MNEIRLDSILHENDECPACGNPKSLGRCAVCARDSQIPIYRERISNQRKRQVRSTPKPAPTSKLENSKQSPPVIPNGPDGKPAYGPGNKDWEDQRKRLTQQKTG